jgi:hypothetical protein
LELAAFPAALMAIAAATTTYGEKSLPSDAIAVKVTNGFAKPVLYQAVARVRSRRCMSEPPVIPPMSAVTFAQWPFRWHASQQVR